MPPKRKQAAPATTTAKRRSKLAKEHNITPEQEEEIQEIWAMFRRDEEGFDSKQGVITLSDARRCLVALNAPPRDNAEWKELIQAMEYEETGLVEYEHFYAIAALKMNAREDDPDARREEVQKAYQLFTKHQDRAININDLKRIAREMKEDVPESLLRDMIREANGGQGGSVDLDHFEDVMQRAGAFG